MPAAVAPARGKAVKGGLQSSRAPKARAGSGSTTSTVAFVCVYGLILYTWWCLCGYYFGIDSGPTTVEPEKDPVLECRRMRVAYEVNQGGDWGKLPEPLRKRWKERECDELFKAEAPAADAKPAAAAAAAVAQPAVVAATATPAAVKPVSVAPAAAAAAATPTAAVAVLPGASDKAAPPDPAPLGSPECPATRRPYHTLLTGQGTTYNGWQSRIMYYHWKKISKRDGRCTEMTGFTRLCASKDGKPDGLEKHIPSVFVPQLTTEVLAKYGHFGVLNRPHSVVEGLKLPALLDRIKEEYVMIAETDHVLMKPLPNLATPTEAAAHSFGYMHASSRHNSVIRLCWPEGDYSSLQPIGPSPVIIHLPQLKKVAQRWLEYSYILRGNPEPARIIQDWVLEMWGYSIAAASVGVRHKIIRNYQIEPNAFAGTTPSFNNDYYIFHYTYGIEYKLDGSPQGYNTIGEWSMDKRHYGQAYPPRDALDPPPERANPSSKWLHAAWHEAANNEPEWPDTNAMGTVGWRREAISEAEIQKSKLASAVVGTRWTWARIPGLAFNERGVLKTPWGVGKWGVALKQPKGMPQCGPPAECLWADFGGAAHHVAFSPGLDAFTSIRVGDGEAVQGAREEGK